MNGSIVLLAALRDGLNAVYGDLDETLDVTLAATRHIVLMTVTMGGFKPLLALMHGSFRPPLAIVIAGGVGLSVVLTLFHTDCMALDTVLNRGR